MVVGLFQLFCLYQIDLAFWVDFDLVVLHLVCVCVGFLLFFSFGFGLYLVDGFGGVLGGYCVWMYFVGVGLVFARVVQIDVYVFEFNCYYFVLFCGFVVTLLVWFACWFGLLAFWVVVLGLFMELVFVFDLGFIDDYLGVFYYLGGGFVWRCFFGVGYFDETCGFAGSRGLI